MNDPSFAMTYWWVASGTGYDSPVSSLSTGFASAASAAGGGGGGGGAD